jgi:hypothetical protein
VRPSATIAEAPQSPHLVPSAFQGLSYRIGREWGWLSPNEIRSLKNLGSIEGGDSYTKPMNMETL